MVNDEVDSRGKLERRIDAGERVERGSRRCPLCGCAYATWLSSPPGNEPRVHALGPAAAHQRRPVPTCPFDMTLRHAAQTVRGFSQPMAPSV